VRGFSLAAGRPRRDTARVGTFTYRFQTAFDEAARDARHAASALARAREAVAACEAARVATPLPARASSPILELAAEGAVRAGRALARARARAGAALAAYAQAERRRATFERHRERASAAASEAEELREEAERDEAETVRHDGR